MLEKCGHIITTNCECSNKSPKICFAYLDCNTSAIIPEALAAEALVPPKFVVH